MAAFFWVVKQQVVVISYRRFGTTYRYHQGSGIQKNLRMGRIGCPEASGRKDQNSLRSNPEESSSQLLLGGSLKSRLVLEDRLLHQEDVCRFLR
jgi:hypothetical protein